MSLDAANYIPFFAQGGKLLPQYLAGSVGLPYVGNIIYVDPTNGSDTANNGGSWDNAFATVAAGYAAATSANHDIVLINPTGGTGRTSETTAIDWAKRFTHLIGNAAPTIQDSRAGISFATGGSLTLSENGCIFNTLTFNGTADINVPVTITGDYNSFSAVDFKGSLNDTTGDDTAARSLVLTGAQENTFSSCTFGADTFMRSGANATVEFLSASSRNQFLSCQFVMAADAETPVHILHGANGVDRYTKFDNCSFYAFYTNHSAKVNAVFNLASQSTTCDIIMSGPTLAVGFDDWEAVATNFMWFQSYTATTSAIGLAINNA
jgi:hypothetical protein